MKADRTISLEELRQIQQSAFHLELLPKSNQVIVDYIKRFNVTDYTLKQWEQSCTQSQH
jgi:CRISPR/Cas system-associated endoribonuclease Cas2